MNIQNKELNSKIFENTEENEQQHLQDFQDGCLRPLADSVISVFSGAVAKARGRPTWEMEIPGKEADGQPRKGAHL